ncbi:Dimer Tnp hAT domain-containing protein [Abeliophyllum distichum]|uniref:Dimer Tnp hAT domain-containing protein n=1 Tax=Abeliophyllum distichum TaxID=126358 RepID=A0ABD1PSA9_9LAMI
MKLLYALYNEYKEWHCGDVGIGGSSSNNGVTLIGSSDDDEDNMNAFNKVDMGYKKLKTSNVDLGGKDVIQKYLEDSTKDPANANFDILNWWKIKSSRFKILSEIARDVLAIPISSVTSESALARVDGFLIHLGVL